MAAIVLEVHRACPLLGLQPGEFLVIDAGGRIPVMRCVHLPPNYGAIAGLIATDGAVSIVNPRHSLGDALLAVGRLSAGPPSPLPPTPTPRRRPLLRVV